MKEVEENTAERWFPEGVVRVERGWWSPVIREFVPGPGRPKGTKRADLSGQVFRHLTVVERVEDHVTRSGKTHARYRCVCDCGSEWTGLGSNLTSGRTTSCGHVGQAKPYSVIGPLRSGADVPADWRERAARASGAYIAAQRRRNGL